MATTYKTIPVYLSGYNTVTGYQCPVSKTAIIKQISLSNETTGVGYVDIKWAEMNSVGIGTTAVNGTNFYPIIISGGVSGFSTARVLQEFISIKANDYLTARTPTSGRVNVIFTVIEQDI